MQPTAQISQPPFVWVPAAHLRARDVEIIKDALVWDSDFKTPMDVVRRVQRGDASCWRYEVEDAYAFLVTEILVHSDKSKTLFLWLFGGKGLFGHHRQLMEYVLTVAEQNDCARLGSSSEPRIARVLQRLFGMKLHSLNLFKEIPNGK